jgi:hypothetical protein
MPNGKRQMAKVDVKIMASCSLVIGMQINVNVQKVDV